MDPLTLGLIGGGVMGVGALGKWATSKDVQAPGGINMADLQRVNPALFKEIMQNEAKINEARSVLESRRRQATAQEVQAMADARNSLQATQSQMGLSGTSAGAGQQGDMEARMRQQIAERAFQEEQAYRAQVDQAQQQAQMSNRAGSEFLWNKAMADYGDQMAKEQQNAQFWNGLMGAGSQLGMSAATASMNKPYQDRQIAAYEKYMANGGGAKKEPPPEEIPVATNETYGNPFQPPAPGSGSAMQTRRSPSGYAYAPDYRYRGYNRGNG